MSSPKEKAAELIDKFIPHTRVFHEVLGWEDYLDSAKQSAIIAVDEIMLICPYLSKENADTLEQLRASDEYFTSFWQQVKIEIQKL